MIVGTGLSRRQCPECGHTVQVKEGAAAYCECQDPGLYMEEIE